MTEKIKKITWEEFFFEVPLYEKIKIERFENNEMPKEIDGYSSKNGIDTTYTTGERLIINKVFFIEGNWGHLEEFRGFLSIKLLCKRRGNEELIFYLDVGKDYIEKVGQAPSLADMQFAALGKKYNKVLERNDLKLFKKAIGLNAHGVGAGSFVYLRRIFEHLIFDTYKINEPDLSIKETDFKVKHMDEKVDILEKYLPEDLVKMKKIYSILSKGVHELEEEDCLKYFPALKLFIELILDQKIEMDKKTAGAKERKKLMDDILQELA